MELKRKIVLHSLPFNTASSKTSFASSTTICSIVLPVCGSSSRSTCFMVSHSSLIFCKAACCAWLLSSSPSPSFLWLLALLIVSDTAAAASAPLRQRDLQQEAPLLQVPERQAGCPNTNEKDLYHCQNPTLLSIFADDDFISCDLVTCEWRLQELDPDVPPSVCTTLDLKESVESSNVKIVEELVIPDLLEPCLWWEMMYGDLSFLIATPAPTAPPTKTRRFGIPERFRETTTATTTTCGSHHESDSTPNRRSGCISLIPTRSTLEDPPGASKDCRLVPTDEWRRPTRSILGATNTRQSIRIVCTSARQALDVF